MGSTLFHTVPHVHISHVVKRAHNDNHVYRHTQGTCNHHYMLSAQLPYSLDQTPLSISRRSRIVAAPPDVLKEIVAALE